MQETDNNPNLNYLLRDVNEALQSVGFGLRDAGFIDEKGQGVLGYPGQGFIAPARIGELLVESLDALEKQNTGGKLSQEELLLLLDLPTNINMAHYVFLTLILSGPAIINPETGEEGVRWCDQETADRAQEFTKSLSDVIKDRDFMGALLAPAYEQRRQMLDRMGIPRNGWRLQLAGGEDGSNASVPFALYQARTPEQAARIIKGLRQFDVTVMDDPLASGLVVAQHFDLRQRLGILTEEAKRGENYRANGVTR